MTQKSVRTCYVDFNVLFEVIKVIAAILTLTKNIYSFFKYIKARWQIIKATLELMLLQILFGKRYEEKLNSIAEALMDYFVAYVF